MREHAPHSANGQPAGDVLEKSEAWDRVLLARHPERPHSLDYIKRLFDPFHEIHGDRSFGDDAAVVCGFCIFKGKSRNWPLMAIGHQKGRRTKEKLHRNFGMPRPEGYRKALRAMKLAEKFGHPVVTFLDTPGAHPGVDAEERGQAEAIARNLFEMSRLSVPLVAICIGEGGSGGALALGMGNRVLMLENAVYSVISPESCAAIVWRDASMAASAAKALKLTAKDLMDLGLVDEVVPEPEGGAHKDADKAADLLRVALEASLEELKGQPSEDLMDNRYLKFRNMGQFYDEVDAS